MREHGYVLLGVDHTDDGSDRMAFDWAAREARSRNTELRLVHAYGCSPQIPPCDTAAIPYLPSLQPMAERRVRQAEHYVADNFPDVQVAGEVLNKDPVSALLDRSRTAAVTVLGSRRLSVMGMLVLGSVSTIVSAKASGPVVVVGAPPGLDAEQPPVVAGIDGSPVTERVLAFAFDHASRHQRNLHIISAWRRDLLAEAEWRVPPVPERAERWLAEATAGWQERYPDVTVHAAVVRERAVDALISASGSCELLVVGARNTHPGVAAMLGSVSQGVLHHAYCPVAVVH